MAIVSLRCKMWPIFLLIFALSAVNSSPDFYEYVADGKEDAPAHFSLLHNSDSRIREKRDEQSVKLLATAAPHEAALNTTVTDKESQLNSINATDQIHSNLTQHNLGVNGTGQRKEYSHLLDKVAVTELPTVNSTALLNGTEVTPSTTTVAIPIVADYNDTNKEDDRAISHHLDEIINKTAEETSALKTEVDNHEYYNSTFTVDPATGEKYWVDMTNMSNARTNELLSHSHRRAATVKLSFDFPFYGHVVRNVTIATGGFLYTGEYVHSWLAATQYIAPLMANFDTSLSNDSYIRHVDNGTAFTVQWERVSLQDKPGGGEFTFQATLHQNGDIIFVYKHVPVYIESIQDEHHPVKVGLSDAYIIDRTIFFVRRKTIYEYHRVNFNREDIKNWTVIYLSALPTCLVNKDCKSCLTKPTGSFECTWCPSSGRCSNGMDRHRQDWLSKGCERKQVKNESQCALAETSTGADGQLVNVLGPMDGSGAHYDTETGGAINGIDHGGPVEDARQASRRVTDDQSVHGGADKGGVSMGISGVLTILLAIGVTAGLATWVLYAYRNPHSASGQMLIKRGKFPCLSEYRPSQWSWRRGEARYTAATIHM